MTAEQNYSVSLLASEYAARQPIRAAVVEVVGKYVPEGGRLVELGSGLGFNLDLLAARYRVIGVEGLSDAARQASERGIETVQADLEHATPLEAAKWDAVLCLDVLEHLLNPLACIAEAYRLLRPAGIFIVNVPNHFTLRSRIRFFLGDDMDAPRFFPEHRAWNYPHVRFFKLDSITQALEQGGFSLVEDLSSRFTAVPILGRLSTFRSICRWLAVSWPDMFCGGFFLIVRKDMQASDVTRPPPSDTASALTKDLE